MRSIRRQWWAALSVAALVAGCSGESGDATSTSTLPASAPAPTIPDAKSATETKAPEPTPAEPKLNEALKPDMPIEGPKIVPPTIEGPNVEGLKNEDAKKADAAVKFTDDELAAIKKLPAAEQTIALSQGLCPVSGEHLGAMDAPLKVSAEGKSFYLCCKGCKKEVDANPKAVLAKLTGK